MNNEHSLQSISTPGFTLDPFTLLTVSRCSRLRKLVARFDQVEEDARLHYDSALLAVAQSCRELCHADLADLCNLADLRKTQAGAAAFLRAGNIQSVHACSSLCRSVIHLARTRTAILSRCLKLWRFLAMQASSTCL